MSYINIADVTKPMHEVLQANVILAKNCDSRYDKRFRASGGQIGDSVSVRYPILGPTVQSGRVAVPESFGDTVKTVTLKQYNASMSLTAKELSLNLDDFKMQILDPLAAQMAAKVDGLVADLIKDVPQALGVPGVPWTTAKTINEAKALMSLAGCAKMQNLVGFLHPNEEAELIQGLSGLFNAQSAISAQYNSGHVGRVSGIDFFSSNIMPAHTMGTIGSSTPLTELTSAPVVEGATSITTDGWASGGTSLKRGDHIQIAGVYAKNPVTGQSTGKLKSYVVTADISDTSGTIVIPVSPAFSTSGVDGVTALPADEATVYLWSDASPADLSGDVGNLNLIMHKDAIVLCSADFGKVPGLDVRTVRDPKLGGIPFQIAMNTDVRTHEVIVRMDCLVGVSLGRDNWAVKIAG